MNKSMNKFALLVPCYNASSFIHEFVENIQKQTKAFDEVVFYDDGSTDDTYIVLQHLGLNVFRDNINKGPSYARNHLSKITRCNWFHFHDIDDLLHPDYLQKTSAIANQNKHEVILCNVDWYDSKGGNIIVKWQYSNHYINKNPLNYTISHPIGGINGLYNKETFSAVKGFNQQILLWEDADLHVRLAANDSKFYVIEESLSFAIRYTNSLSANQKKAWLTRLVLLEEYFKLYGEKSNRITIGIEAQKTASSLVIYKEFSAAKSALFLSEKCGIQVPNSNNLIWRVLKLVLPVKIRVNLRILQLKTAFN